MHMHWAYPCLLVHCQKPVTVFWRSAGAHKVLFLSCRGTTKQIVCPLVRLWSKFPWGQLQFAIASITQLVCKSTPTTRPMFLECADWDYVGDALANLQLLKRIYWSVLQDTKQKKAWRAVSLAYSGRSTKPIWTGMTISIFKNFCLSLTFLLCSVAWNQSESLLLFLILASQQADNVLHNKCADFQKPIRVCWTAQWLTRQRSGSLWWKLGHWKYCLAMNLECVIISDPPLFVFWAAAHLNQLLDWDVHPQAPSCTHC